MQYYWILIVVALLIYIERRISGLHDFIMNVSHWRRDEIRELEKKIEKIEGRLGHSE